jgi:hypothetical protein
MEAWVSVAVFNIVIVVLALALAFVAFAVPAQLLELPALSHRVLGTLKKGQGRFLRSSNFLLFLLDFLDLSMEARVLSGPRFLLDFPP